MCVIGGYGTEGEIPIYAFRAVIFRFQGRRDVRVNPKGPERIVEIEDDQLREREAICEGFWGADLVVEDGGWDTCYRRPSLFFDHLRVENED